MTESVIVAGARTPIGKFLGAFSEVTAQDLGGAAIKAALDRSGVKGGDVDYVIIGQVLQAAQGQITARQAAVKAGIPMNVPCMTINKVCLSGLNAIAMADQLVRLGEVEMVVAGGMESMTAAPYALARGRQGFRMGHAQALDLMIHDGLWCAFEDRHMGEGSDRHAERLNITRAEQDEWAARSHELAAEATKAGRLGEEITPFSIPQRKGDPTVVEEDEGIRPGTTSETLAKLSPAFTKEGSITAGNASQISDGAAAVVVTSRDRAELDGLPILATIRAHGMVAGPDPSLESQPSRAIQKASEKIGKAPGSFDLYEINEAFASVAIQSARELEIDQSRVNPNGGAIALGHPIGMSGARLVLSLAMELRRRGGGFGAAALCGGGGQGDALLIESTGK